MDTDSVYVEDSCVLCDRTEAYDLKCCPKKICFKCYNKMTRSGRTLACPHCRKTPLQFYDEDDDSSSEEESPVPVNNNPELEFNIDFIPHNHPMILEPIISHDFFNFIQRSFIIQQQTRENLNTKIVFGVQFSCMLLYFIIYYFLPKWTVLAFFIGYILRSLKIAFICKIALYPLDYSIYFFNNYVHNSIAWKYIRRLNLI